MFQKLVVLLLLVSSSLAWAVPELPFRVFDKASCVSSVLKNNPEVKVELATRLCAHKMKIQLGQDEPKKESVGIFDRTAAVSGAHVLTPGQSAGIQ